MTLNDVLHILHKKPLETGGDREIASVVCDSRQASARCVFVAVAGLRADGHGYLDAAYRAGARVFVTQRPCNLADAVVVVVPDTRTALAALAACLYEDPSQNMKLIGITGTNGKTTTAFLIESIIRQAGLAPGLVSTVAYRYASVCRDAGRTTPGPVDLQHLLRNMADAGTGCVVMEVSSHGLEQRRIEGCRFDVGVFTNLTAEHLDYHGTMEAYYRSKERFFTEVLQASSKARVTAVINRDDPQGGRLLAAAQCRTVTYGLASGDIHADAADLSLEGTKARIVTPRGGIDVTSRLIGQFNLYNMLAAAAACLSLDIPLETIKAGIEGLAGVPGRMERIENKRGILVFVDFAHTGDALENVLSTLKKTGAGRIITIFGCGGDRDREKRPVMGRVAADYSAVVILTSDNPRSENPEDILREIERGVAARGFSPAPGGAVPPGQTGLYVVRQDRREAIRTGITMARPGDVVLIAGKGHETTQEAGAEKKHFDDREEARQALKLCA